MDKLRKLLKEFALLYDILNTFLGIAMLILIVLAFRFSGNRVILVAAFFCGGLMNIINGLKIIKDPKRKSMGMSYIMFGIVIIFMGCILL